MFPGHHPASARLALEGFEILERLGMGGAGAVFLARSRGGKLVAIKTIAEAHRDHDSSADSFAHEASVCAALIHPCIVQVRAFLEEPGFAALVYEYVPGVALGRVLRLCHAHGVRLPDGPAWHIAERVLSALAYAHGFRDGSGQTTPIVHRDVSPSNVLLDWDGGVKIADFGIAKVLGVSPATRFGLVKGTLGCMAPEQARGEAVDERADVYAAALLAWRLATGRVPFAKHQKDEFELLRAMRNPRIKPLAVIRPDLPEPLLEAIAVALEPEPARRTITASELAEVLREHVDVDAGGVALADLLQRWKVMLERGVKRAPEADADSIGGRAVHTLRYEEVALAFDDDAGGDGPTLVAHALPDDLTALDALPLAERDPAVTSAPPAPAALPVDASPAEPPSPSPSPPPEPAAPTAPPRSEPRAVVEPRARPRPRTAVLAWGALVAVAAMAILGSVVAALLR